MLAPPQARRSEPGGWRPRRGPSTWIAMLAVPGKSSGKVSDIDSLLQLFETPQLVVGQSAVSTSESKGGSRVRQSSVQRGRDRVELRARPQIIESSFDRVGYRFTTVYHTIYC